MEEDGTTVEEWRAALAQIVKKIEFDPATGTGHIQLPDRSPGMSRSVLNEAR
jgi:hypothetical protein